MPKFSSELTPELKYEILGIILTTAGLMALVSLLGLNTGAVGQFIVKFLKYSFGIGAPIIPFLLTVIGLRYVWKRSAIIYSLKFIGFVSLYVIFLAIYHHAVIAVGQEIMPDSLPAGGGLIGGFTLFSLRKLFGVDGSIILLIGLSICSLILSFTWSFTQTMITAKHKAEESVTAAREAIASAKENYFDHTEDEAAKFYDQKKDVSFKIIHDEAEPAYVEPDFSAHTAAVKLDYEVNDTGTDEPTTSSYVLPPVSLLKKPSKPRLSKVPKEIADNARILEETLDNFGVSAKIINTCQGPAVTRYELEPAPGVKVSKIVNLADDLALKLAASGIRIEAPIPGKAAIGIEVPNKTVTGVILREVIESEEFQSGSSKLTVGLGKDIAGQVIVTDLGKMPHLLVAGATGSGKSVCINTIITSILYKSLPTEVKLVLIDPKMVELSNYNGIPQLLTPVVTDAKKAASALNWAVQEMERRYGLFAQQGARDLVRYNEMIAADNEEVLPLIVIIIDELADLMMVAPVDVETAIARLAQKARAAGIHLVLATQRPSVDVITGTIKANIPSRISFAVSSQVDSRTILDMSGAEKLLGKGDMLFFPVGAAKPLRIQGAFIDDSEVEELVNFLSRQGQPVYSEEVTSGELVSDKQVSSETPAEDELLEDAVRIVLETGQASVSMLQRKFRIGYSRAARMIDTMEEMKIVGPSNGSKAREVIMTSDQVYSRYFKKN